MAAALARGASEAEPRHHDARHRLSDAGNRPRRFVQSHATSAHEPGEPTRNPWADRSAPRTQDQIRLAPDPGMAWPNPHGYHDRRGFRVPGQDRSVADPDRVRNYRSQMVRAAVLRLDERPRSAAGGRKPAASK